MPALVHGARSGYAGGCRCAKCKAWNAEKTRKYRETKAENKAVAAKAPRRTRAARGTAVSDTRKTGANKPDRILGPLEASLAQTFASIDGASTELVDIWSGPLRVSALGAARSVDEDPALWPRVMPQLFGILERLGLAPAAAPAKPPAQQAPVSSSGEDDDDTSFVSGLRDPRGSAPALLHAT